MIYIQQLKLFLCISCLYQLMDDYLEGSGMCFLTDTLFRKCHLSKTTLALVSLILLPLCSRCNLRLAQSTSPRWQPVPEHTRNETLTYCCVLRIVPLNQPLPPHILMCKRCNLAVSLCGSFSVSKKQLKMLLLLLLETALCFISLYISALYISEH